MDRRPGDYPAVTAPFPPEYPSDRWQDSPDLGVSVDTVTLTGPTSRALCDELRYQQINRIIDYDTGEVIDHRHGASSTLPVGLGSVRLTARMQTDAPILKIETSLPRVFQGHNRNGLPRDLLFDGVDALLSELSDELPGIPAVGDVALARLDLARDFHGLRSPSRTLAALGRRHVERARTRSDYQRPDGSTQCITRGSHSQYVVRGYAKEHELRESARNTRDTSVRDCLLAWAAASAGQLRYELQVRTPVLKRKGLRHLTDMTPDRLHALAEEYYHLAGWDLPIAGDAADNRLRGLLPDLTTATQRSLMVYLYAVEHDLEPPLDRHALEKVRPLARRHQLVGHHEDDGPMRHLDFATGTETELDA